MAAETQRLKLATYEYKTAPYAGRRHLGPPHDELFDPFCFSHQKWRPT
jgi:hypothetical protein